jgi:hypothetical protein
MSAKERPGDPRSTTATLAGGCVLRALPIWKTSLDPWPTDFDPPVSLDPALCNGARRIDARVLVRTEAGTTAAGCVEPEGTTARGRTAKAPLVPARKKR